VVLAVVEVVDVMPCTPGVQSPKARNTTHLVGSPELWEAAGPLKGTSHLPVEEIGRRGPFSGTRWPLMTHRDIAACLVRIRAGSM
jgi:hypothetical protein